VDVEHIMRLDGWEMLDMVVMYTRSVKFEDSLKMYEMYTTNDNFRLVGDFDGDGQTEILVTNYHGFGILKNEYQHYEPGTHDLQHESGS
jgi:hypothetical protein